MNINLREEATTAYISFYQNYLEEVQSLNKKVTDVLNEVMQESKYDKLQQRISGIIDAYMEVIVNDIESGVFAAWTESTGSLRTCLRTYRAGDSADAVCAQIEMSMGGLMQDILKIEKADAIITERPIVSEDGLERLEDVCRNAQAEIQGIKSEYIAQTDSRNDENEIYGTLRPLFEGVAANIESFFEASLDSFIKLHEFVKEASAKTQAGIQDAIGGSGGKQGADEAPGNIGGAGSASSNSKVEPKDFCPMWQKFLEKTEEFEKECDQDQTISEDEKKKIKEYYMRSMYVRIENELKHQTARCLEIKSKEPESISLKDATHLIDVCMWENCLFRSGLKVMDKGQAVQAPQWPGNHNEWRDAKKIHRGIAPYPPNSPNDSNVFDAIGDGVDYQKVKAGFHSERLRINDWIQNNWDINVLQRQKKDEEGQIEKLKKYIERQKTKNAAGSSTKEAIAMLEDQIKRAEERIRVINGKVGERKVKEAPWIEGARDIITDDEKVIKYILSFYEQLEAEVIEEDVIDEIIETMPWPLEWGDGVIANKKKKYHDQILCEMKKYCGIEMKNPTTNMDYKYRKKLMARKENGDPNAVKLFDHFAEGGKFVIYNDNETGTARFKSNNEYGVHFNPAMEEDRQKAGDTFFHEIGHHIDYLLGRPSEQAEFLKAFREDREMFVGCFNGDIIDFGNNDASGSIPYDINKEELIGNLDSNKTFAPLSDLVRGWNLILINDKPDKEGDKLQVKKCEDTVYDSYFYRQIQHELQREIQQQLQQQVQQGQILTVQQGQIQVSQLPQIKIQMSYKINNEYCWRLVGGWGHDGYNTFEIDENNYTIWIKPYYDFYFFMNDPIYEYPVNYRYWIPNNIRESATSTVYRKKFQPEHEAFAEMYEADMGGSAETRKLFEKYLSKTWKKYREIIDNWEDYVTPIDF